MARRLLGPEGPNSMFDQGESHPIQVFIIIIIMQTCSQGLLWVVITGITRSGSN